MDYEQFAVTTQVQGFPVQRFKVRDQPAMNLDNLIRVYISKRVQRCLRAGQTDPAAAGLPFVDSSTISKNMESAK